MGDIAMIEVRDSVWRFDTDALARDLRGQWPGLVMKTGGLFSLDWDWGKLSTDRAGITLDPHWKAVAAFAIWLHRTYSEPALVLESEGRGDICELTHDSTEEDILAAVDAGQSATSALERLYELVASELEPVLESAGFERESLGVDDQRVVLQGEYFREEDLRYARVRLRGWCDGPSVWVMLHLEVIEPRSEDQKRGRRPLPGVPPRMWGTYIGPDGLSPVGDWRLDAGHLDAGVGDLAAMLANVGVPEVLARLDGADLV